MFVLSILAIYMYVVQEVIIKLWTIYDVMITKKKHVQILITQKISFYSTAATTTILRIWHMIATDSVCTNNCESYDGERKNYDNTLPHVVWPVPPSKASFQNFN